jgi:hypothetical protein
MPLGYFFIANWKKIALVLFLLVAIAPFVLLHVFVLCQNFRTEASWRNRFVHPVSWA